jgi:hypothetical protein
MGMTGLCYNRTIWRCNIKRLINKKDKTDFFFLNENTTYGNIMQNAITYHKGILPKLINWINKLNEGLIKPVSVDSTKLYKRYELEFPIYSDIFSFDKQTKNYFYYYNIDLLKTAILSNKEKQAIVKHVQNYISVLTADLLALLNVFHHFNDSSMFIDYVNKIGANHSTKKYVNDVYLNHNHFLLNHYFQVLTILNEKEKAEELKRTSAKFKK